VQLAVNYFRLFRDAGAAEYICDNRHNGFSRYPLTLFNAPVKSAGYAPRCILRGA
jgi:hypothetical protein